MVLIVHNGDFLWQVLDVGGSVLEEGRDSTIESAKDAAMDAYNQRVEARLQAIFSMLAADDAFMGRNSEFRGKGE